MYGATDTITIPAVTRSMREIALEGWTDEVNDRQHDAWMRGDHDWEPLWESYASNRNEELDFVPPGAIVLVSTGGATVTVEGDVGADAIIIVTGGGAAIEVHGDVGSGARLYVGGGGSKISIKGAVGEHAKVFASGGGTEIEVGSAAATVEFRASGACAKVRRLTP